MESELQLTKYEINKYGGMQYWNSYYKRYDYDPNDRYPLHIHDGYPKRLPCGCKVIVYDNYVGDPNSRNVYSNSRLISTTIRKVINCEEHTQLIKEYNEMQQKIKEFEHDYNEVLPMVTKKLNANTNTNILCISEMEQTTTKTI